MGWSRLHKQCVECATAKTPHKGRGLCFDCYNKRRDRTDARSRVAQAKYRANNKEKIKEANRTSYRKNRIEMFNLLGNKCIRCGFSDMRALQIDHINGGGVQERRQYSIRDYHIRVLRSLRDNGNKYQLLCANCNWIKRHENQEWGKVSQ